MKKIYWITFLPSDLIWQWKESTCCQVDVYRDGLANSNRWFYNVDTKSNLPLSYTQNKHGPSELELYWIHVNRCILFLEYSKVSNKRPVCNKRPVWKISKNLRGILHNFGSFMGVFNRSRFKMIFYNILFGKNCSEEMKARKNELRKSSFWEYFSKI